MSFATTLPRLANKPNNAVPNYDEKKLPQYNPMPWTIKEIRDAIPAKFFVRNTALGLAYCARDFVMAAVCWYAATYIDPTFQSSKVVGNLSEYLGGNPAAGKAAAEVLRWSAWGVYWWFQGLIFTGIWVIGHECGHSAFSANRRVCDVIGFVTHTLMWTPYFSWRISHHRHHSNHASMEKDEVYVPKTRTDLGLPQEKEGVTIDYDDLLGDTPIHALYMLLRQQVLAFPAYLLFNVSGQKTYPKWTNHFDPNSILFNASQRNAVLISNAGIIFMMTAVTVASRMYGFGEVVKYYAFPWLCVSHWFIMITYLHHTDPMLPHYRKNEWNFQRGAAATVDRDFLGWQGRFFLHDVAHFHVIHHFFPQMPFYHGPEATQYLKAFIGEHYASSAAPVFKTLWDTYNFCQFVEDEGDILFYRNKKGQACRRLADDFVPRNAKKIE